MEGSSTTVGMHAGTTPGVVPLLQDLVRYDTVNPPGNEQALQEQLHGLLSAAGFDCELLAAEPGRPNLIARLDGQQDGPTLCLLGHVDTVRADPEEWSHDPWSGDLADGEIWGRGALDMKGQVAAEVAAALALGESGWRPRRGTLLLAIVADEETGGGAGARWLCEHHPEKVRCDIVVNEGGGSHFDFEGRRFYSVGVAEKGVCRFELVTHGVAGHASLPGVGENAMLKIAPFLERMAASQPPAERSPEADGLIAALLGDDALEEEPAKALERIRASAPELATLLLEPMLGVTLVPTKISASEKANVIPSRCSVLVDCRVPPGLGAEHAEAQARKVLGDGDYSLHFVEEVVGSRSPADTRLMDAISAWVARADPGAETVPAVLPGFSDSHWFRTAFGATAYGFFPHRAMSLAEVSPLAHAADERVAIEDLELAAECYGEIVQEVLG